MVFFKFNVLLSSAFAAMLVSTCTWSLSSANSEFISNSIEIDETNPEAEDCTRIGLNPETLSCSSCQLLEKFELNDIRANCLRCCNTNLDKTSDANSQDSSTVYKKYPKARLEVCWCKFPSMPQIEAFVKSDRPKKFPTLTIKHIPAQSPIIKLMDADGNVEQTLTINKWDTDTIEEFFSMHLDTVAANPAE